MLTVKLTGYMNEERVFVSLVSGDVGKGAKSKFVNWAEVACNTRATPASVAKATTFTNSKYSVPNPFPASYPSDAHFVTEVLMMVARCCVCC